MVPAWGELGLTGDRRKRCRHSTDEAEGGGLSLPGEGREGSSEASQQRWQLSWF